MEERTDEPNHLGADSKSSWRFNSFSRTTISRRFPQRKRLPNPHHDRNLLIEFRREFRLDCEESVLARSFISRGNRRDCNFHPLDCQETEASVESIQQSASPSLAQTANPNITQQVFVQPAPYREPEAQQSPLRRLRLRLRRGQLSCRILFSLEPETLSLQARHWIMFCRKKEIVKVVLPTSQLSLHVFETSLQVKKEYQMNRA